MTWVLIFNGTIYAQVPRNYSHVWPKYEQKSWFYSHRLRYMRKFPGITLTNGQNMSSNPSFILTD
ncbi:hypothetical protein JOC48_001841 [Aquibacillus albus]|uniref:Uncharacterized protein n=1 Tax=Aquibacillus albus TaxID=1168171 RepID=A0ABS2MZR1_9BACI|nr:hypothetical protein [Aquibacillus albus]